MYSQQTALNRSLLLGSGHFLLAISDAVFAGFAHYFWAKHFFLACVKHFTHICAMKEEQLLSSTVSPKVRWLSQKAVAEMFRVSQASISHITNGRPAEKQRVRKYGIQRGGGYDALLTEGLDFRRVPHKIRKNVNVLEYSPHGVAKIRSILLARGHNLAQNDAQNHTQNDTTLSKHTV